MIQNRASLQGTRVAIVLSELRPGGMERVVVHLANGLASRGIPTMVVCLQNPGELAHELDCPRVQFAALRSSVSWDVNAVWSLSTLFRQFRPSVMNVHDYTGIPYAVIANTLSRRAPLLFTAHGLLYEGFDSLRGRHRFFSKWLTGLSAVSMEVAIRHREYLGWSRPASIIGNGVPAFERNTALRETVRGELGCGPQDTLFLAVGNPRPEKGFEDLIDATAILRKMPGSKANFLVAVAGRLTDSSYCRMLHRRIQDYGLNDCFRLIGFRTDMTALYSAADIFVLSSRSEGLPMVVLEAMTLGLPVIATRVGGIPEAVKGNGLLIEPAAPEQLAHAMLRIIGETGLAGRLGEAGRRYALLNHSVGRMVDDYVAWYRVMMERRKV